MKVSRIPIHPAALEQHVAVLGKTRSGKSSKMRVLVEALLDDHEDVVIVDKKGDWWGLKSSADGKSSGFPIVIFGGPHADVPINENSGAQLAELLAGGGRSCVIDLKGWRPSAYTKFFIDFVATLYRLNHGRKYLLLDEVHNYAPKGKVFSPQAGEMLHWANTVATEGQGLGLILLAASQRPQRVHNDLLTSCETLIACRVIHKADRDAIKDWIDGCADPKVGAQVLADLAQMPRADAWCWSPEIGFGPERITWPMFKTYDSFKPQPVTAKKLKGWASVDLGEVREKLDKVIAEATANDPRALRTEIARLKSELAKKTPAAAIPSAAAKLLPGALRDAGAIIKRQKTAIEQLMKFIVKVNATNFAENVGLDPQALSKAFESAVAKAMKLVDSNIARRAALLHGLKQDGARVAEAISKLLADDTVEIAVAVQRNDPITIKRARQERPPAASRAPSGEGIGTGGQRRIMIALAQNPDGITARKLSILANIARGGGTWRTYMAKLRGDGLIEGNNERLKATAAGVDALGDYEPLPTGEALVTYWRNQLGESGKRKIFDAVVAAYPNAISKQEVSDHTGIALGGGTWRTYMAELRGLELISGTDELTACEDFFQ